MKKQFLVRKNSSNSRYLRRDCVICLQKDGLRAQLSPCGHDQFDYSCICRWMDQSLTCPICKRHVDCVFYGFHGSRLYKKWYTQSLGSNQYSISRQLLRQPSFSSSENTDRLADLLRVRRFIYQKAWKSYENPSLSSHRQYQIPTPIQLASSASLLKKVESFIAKELLLFEYLDGQQINFIQIFLMGLLRVQNIQHPQTIDELAEFIGHEESSILLHELQRYLQFRPLSISSYMYSKRYLYGPEGLTMVQLLSQIENTQHESGPETENS
ncbi:Ubiquitin-protein ligase E3 [Schizosaccharomyces pombe]